MTDTIRTHGYQDDLDTNEDQTDVVTHEATDEPSNWTGNPNDALKDDLDRQAIDELGRGSEDLREHIEDMDEADKNDR